jgi:hypothetical protein
MSKVWATTYDVGEEWCEVYNPYIKLACNN